MTIKLESLQSNKGSRRKKMRKGRGISAGQGASCGFGMRGQKSRSGRPTRPGFEGGQMPLYRRLPKRGFNPIKTTVIAKINIGKIQLFIEKKKIKANEKINLHLLKKLKLISGKYNKIKILGTGDLNDKIDIEANFVSKSVKEKLDKTGSTVKILK